MKRKNLKSVATVKNTVIGIAIAVSLSVLFPVNSNASGKTRTMSGTYYNYMCIVTKDGHEWLLSDKQSKSNPYMKRVVRLYNGRRKVVYVPVFKPGQKVIVKFDTRGTKRVTDDRIISVKKNKK